MIQNFEELATNDLRRDALTIAEAGYAAIRVDLVLQNKVLIVDSELHIGGRVYPLVGRRIYFVGVGKGSFVASGAIEQLLGDTLTAGIALDVFDDKLPDSNLKKIETYVGTHPLPSEENVRATWRIIEFLSGRRADDLVILFISGGGSTLLCLNKKPMTCSDEKVLFEELTANGAPIQDINTVRKHISRARGGALAVAAYPAEVVSLIASDVPHNDILFVASGPTVRDTSTVADAQTILAKYAVTSPTNVELIETEKEEKYFTRVNNILLLTNRDAIKAMRDEASRRGYAPEIVDDCFTGEAGDIGRAIVEELHSKPSKTALIYAGESTVTLGTTKGRGGRSQEVALSALEGIRDDELVLPFASDGHDNTDHAGAIADEITRANARDKNVSVSEHREAHTSYDFFSATGDALITGYTGSNVSDLIIALKK